MAPKSPFPAPVDTHARYTGVLAAAVMGIYVLIIVGATTTITNAATACTTWPACGGQWLVPLDDPKLLIAWGHRVVALVVGLLVLATALLTLLGETSRRVRASVLGSVALYPVQVGVGALAATTAVGPYVRTAHLLLGTAIFTGLVVALAWTLEEETATERERAQTDIRDETDPVEGPERAPDIPSDPLTRARLTLAAYYRLMKPRLMWLLCLVAAAGMALAAGRDLRVDTIVYTLGGGVLSIGASGTFNHVLERDVDRKMNRTSDRPLATDLVPVRHALAWGTVLAVASLALFAQVNLLAAALGFCAILFYSVVYTLVLKPNTVQNTVIGGAAGALPALIGWAAVTGTIGLPGLVLAGVIFLWTPAHFYNLALAYKEDYARGGFPMMPVVRGEALTRKHILWYFAATLLSAVALSAVGTLDLLYALTSAAVGGLFLWTIVRLHYEKSEGAAFRAFHASNAYLGLLLVAVMFDAMLV